MRRIAAYLSLTVLVSMLTGAAHALPITTEVADALRRISSIQQQETIVAVRLAGGGVFQGIYDQVNRAVVDPEVQPGSITDPLAELGFLAGELTGLATELAELPADLLLALFLKLNVSDPENDPEVQQALQVAAAEVRKVELGQAGISGAIFVPNETPESVDEVNKLLADAGLTLRYTAVVAEPGIALLLGIGLPLTLLARRRKRRTRSLIAAF